MGLISKGMDVMFGDGRNVVADTVGIFRESAENAGAREAAMKDAALGQFAAEFARPRKGLFDRVIDGLNRLPRPLLAFGTIGLFIVAMVDPIWFSGRMQGLALVPEPLWWLMGAIVSFYFGARHQAKGQEFQASVVESAARAGTVQQSIRALRQMEDAPEQPATPGEPNPALEEWWQAR
ncbi:holin family protein [Pelagovum pacificum]|uniref:Carboxylesterase n=1 Tax=Pelagovum pacificum TaxID=2588711 RepID=A0A5C5GEB8_9RHOB|nr:holin family protein [Pelagovum pacificum]QQA44597.1 holin family protein [Pelagovum pacificum]TNY32291.1 carboxylesterase [Pelagovum pacificum]